ncbi:ABC transporter permease [Halanaerobium salsuginis]|jgi:NitT/TauT family transport system permease protein|uniref:NitT/TauT family transport system permease protein n=1 Tax=Halanaerobium salsuginis TaxID=29563 RepID=A0A1I4IK15_9FIRM|nr:ABC transporter permease [Halanaerobium salsuginis]SFL54427.1 NitT/TauT family transport system permease protein [Halanaerobium salsuginis]
MKQSKFSTFYALVFVFFSWVILYFWLDSNIIASPLLVAVTFSKILVPELLPNLLFSIFRILSAVIISLVLGVSIGVLTGLYTRIDKYLAPLIYLLYPIPKIAFLPVFMLLFGLGNLSKVIILIAIIIFQIIVTTRDGVRNIDSKYFASARSLGMGSKDIYFQLVLPAILPGILTALRITVGTSIAVLFFAENFAVHYGIGYYIMNSWSMVNYPKMYCGIIAVSLLGYFLFKVIDFLEIKFCSWQKVN